jgi:DNA invertase Pin-like site-specific DNA recombinase
MTNFGYLKIYYGESEESIKQQRESLLKSGVELSHIYEDSALKTPQDSDSSFNNLLKLMHQDDLFIVNSWDRLGNFLSGILKSLEALLRNNISWKTLEENINSKDNVPEFWVEVFKALIVCERNSFQRTSKEGIRLKGRKPKPKSISDPMLKEIQSRLKDGEPLATIAKSIEVSRPTIYRALERLASEPTEKETSL